MPFLDNVINRGKAAGQKTKLKADILLIQRRMQTRKKHLGVDLYNDLSPITCHQDFYATNDVTISTIRPELLSTDREIRALDARKLQAKGDLDLLQQARNLAFPAHVAPATNWKEKAQNAKKGAGFAANEAKLKTELKVIQTKVNGLMEEFGLKIFPVLEELFGTSSGPIMVHSSTDEVVNRIREFYRDCHNDLTVLGRSVKEKQELIDKLNVDVNLRRMGGT